MKKKKDSQRELLEKILIQLEHLNKTKEQDRTNIQIVPYIPSSPYPIPATPHYPNLITNPPWIVNPGSPTGTIC